ncbi:LOW QUALITY PROTEIN: ATP-binding cassette sub-family C member 10-like [Tachypleus tridentatus]|uniref:LOW QUALITY PROTEIN: ATP-binding cassette sub-family C member 10-like n=1 Tax=Tachypleus tridentatus TaxID=6853 RepID=UPI003FD45033
MQSLSLGAVPVTEDGNDDIDEDFDSSGTGTLVRRQKFSLLQVLHRCFGKEFYLIGMLKLLADSLGFAGPLMLNLLVSFLENKLEPASHGCYYAAGLFSATFLSAICSSQFGYLITKVGLKIRAAIITTIYRKTLGVSKTNLSSFSTGEIINFMSTDSERIVNFCQSFHQFWSLPLQVGVTLFLLYQQVGLAFLAGLLFAILIIPINRWLAIKIGVLSKDMMEQKDKRIKLMNEFLSGIRVIKMFAWERIFAARVQATRNEEMNLLKARKYLDALCVYFWATTPVLISVLTFSTYVVMGNQLTAAKVFTSVALFNMLIMPLNAFPWVLNGLMEAWVSLNRVQKFLQTQDLHLDEYYTDSGVSDSKIVVENGCFSWVSLDTSKHSSHETLKSFAGSSSYEHENQFILGPVDLKVKKGHLIGVIGKVGSGKSSLLSALVADLVCKKGYVRIHQGDIRKGIGYVPQEAWIQNSTVRSNILFGKPYNEKKYKGVLEACALLDDLKELHAGDETEVGERGITLSGGQKARIALGRAVYQDFDIYLLDDPFSAVDPHIAEHLFTCCILGLLKDKTRIICTHHTQFCQKMDFVVLLEKGRVIAQGSPSLVFQSHPMCSFKEPEFGDEPSTSRMSSDSPRFSFRYPENLTPETLSVESLSLISLTGFGDDRRVDRSVQDEEREYGTVQFHVYKSFWLAVGHVLGLCVLFALLLMQTSRTLSDWWLAYWISHTFEGGFNFTDNNHSHSDTIDNSLCFSKVLGKNMTNATLPNDNLTFYMVVYGSLAAANSVFTLFRAFLFAYGGICAAVILHDKLLCNILKARVTFFDVTSLGRLLNRFSSDLYTVDDSLPFIINILLAQFFSLIGTLAITCFGLPWIILLLVPLGAVYYNIQRYYRHTSRELKRLSSISLSPIYTHFSETLSGLTAIRSYSVTLRFHEENLEKLDSNQQAQFCALGASQWLNLRLQMIGVAIVTGVAVLAIIEHAYAVVDPGLIGLAISYALSVTSLLGGVVTSFTETEKEMVSVERVVQYIDGVESEKMEGIHQPPFSWPSQGVITFYHVCLQYRPGLPLALSDVSFETKPRERLGIVGRTGSGKSSLFQVLFRITDLAKGEILIDGVDISQIGLQELRSRLAIIPQDPFVFSGTVRENLDPRGWCQDTELWRALEQCHLHSTVKQMGGLDIEVGERGQRFSVGQRQLLCLVRALICQAKILCIDEATANVDRETDRLIQQTIRTAFRQTTILTIAHRMETVMDSERVLVMQNGRLIEFDSPQVLLQDPNSHFFSMVYGHQE